MGDRSQDPNPRPRPDASGPPRGYLPRIAYQAPGAGPSDGSDPTAPPRAHRPAEEDPPDDAPRRVLKEETPGLDTVEVRQKARWLIGGVASLSIVVSGLVLLRALLGTEEPLPPEDSLPVEIVGLKAVAIRPDQHAELLLGEAKRFAQNGRLEPARLRLTLLTKNFPGTTAATSAGEALARLERHEPLFPDPSAPPPPAPAPEPEPAPEPAPVALVEPARPLALPPPEVEPEPRRPTPPTFETADIPARPLPPGFRPRPEAGVHPSGWPLEITCDRDGATLVLVPAGIYPAGSDTGRFSERPAHTVQLGSYYIDQHEVTNAQFARFRKATGRLIPRGTPPPGDLPAVGVTHEEAWSYAQWSGKRLPTEAQWEAAARSTAGQATPWGDPLPERAKTPPPLQPVLSREHDRSPLAVFDLGGNAWEWTGDWFDARYYQSLPRTGPALEPLGPERSGSRTPEISVKGGSPRGDASWREGVKPDARLPLLGFRCALPIGDPPLEPPPEPEPVVAPTPATTPPAAPVARPPAPSTSPAAAPQPETQPSKPKSGQAAPVPF